MSVTNGRVALVILAGGQGLRLGGVIKANLLIDGVSLLARVVRAMPEDVELVLSIGKHDPADFALPCPMRLVPDVSGDGGPLAGLRAAASVVSAQRDIAFFASVAVDTPFLPTDFIERLLGPLQSGFEASVAQADGQLYPTNALFRLATLQSVLPRLAGGDRPFGPKALLGAMRSAVVEWAVGPDGDPFASINTPADLAAAAARAAGRRTV